MPSPAQNAFRSGRLARALAAAALLAGGLAGCGDDAAPVAKLTPAQVQERLATTPPGLSPAARELEEQAGQVLDGGADPVKTLEAKVKALGGVPAVVNVWADWCAPCKKEMPIFQRVALDQRGQVAFFGVASQTSKAKTENYLKQIAMPFPSVLDEDGDVIDLTGVDGLPKTFFYDSAGKRYVHNGPYTSEAELLADVKRYAS